MSSSGADSRSHPTGQAPAGLDASRIDRGEVFEFQQWDQDGFHSIEVQTCSKTETVQFSVGDYSGDYHGENPSGCALSLDDAEALASFVLDQITTIRELMKERR